MKHIVAIDTETCLIGPGAVAPRLICASFAAYDQAQGHNVAVLYGNAELPKIEKMLSLLLDDDDTLLVFHNGAFDLTVISAAMPHLLPLIFAKLEAGLITDTKIREKLLNLSTHGKLELLKMPDGSSEPIKYSLATLVLNYMGNDRMEEKLGEDIWRMHYEQLDGLVADDYPQEAQDYAMRDALDTLEVYMLQAEMIAGESGRASVKTEAFQTAVDFALRLQTCWGFSIDQSAVDDVQAMLADELAPDRLQLLVDGGILTPALPERPFKNGAKLEDGTPKMKAATKDKISKKLLQTHVEGVCSANQLPVLLTPKGGVSTAVAVLQTLAPLDPVLAQYQHRQSLQKLVTTYMPQLEGNDMVHPDYDVLKETGRTSSFGSRLYPSCNIQQVDPRVRQCFVPREGYLLCSADYSAIELASFGQRTYDMFGYSVHKDKINAGVDLHAYLGAQLAYKLAPVFHDECYLYGKHTPDEIYTYFLTTQDTQPDFYDKWRTMGKVTGLAKPGGMGDETFLQFVRGYGIDCDLELAEAMGQVWLDTYPEAEAFFKAINKDFIDPHNKAVNDLGQEQTLYAYHSPMGMYRAGATYCAAANGTGLQTPTAEGAKSAVFQVARACYDSTLNSSLYGSRPVAFVHDELIVEILDDKHRDKRALLIAAFMVDAMQAVLPDVIVKVDPVLMRRWSKSAKQVFDKKGRLAVWTPEEK